MYTSLLSTASQGTFSLTLIREHINQFWTDVHTVNFTTSMVSQGKHITHRHHH